ncbi:MAG TPA: hypothetical protein PKC99_17080 [Anaerolineales bacterium]|nr:hypothetical protein [Anaerolineales bacterium]
MNYQQAIEYLMNYGNYATDSEIRTPDDRILHVSDFCAEVIAAQQSVQRTCANCGADDWRDAIVPDTLEICNRCGASR